MRILLVRGSSDGGVRRHVAQSADLLAANHRVLVAAPDIRPAEGNGSWRSVIVPIADRPRASDLRAWRQLRRLAADADIVHAHGLRAGALSALATGSTPLVVTLHNRPIGSGVVKTIGALLLRVALRKAAVVLTVSPDLTHMAMAAGARRCLPAIVPAPPRSVGAASGDIRAELDLPADTQVLLTVARLAPQKGLALLAEVASRLPTGHLVWLVAGEGPERAWLTERIAAEHLPVRLLGRRDDVGHLLASADLVISTAQWEGQPVWLQEAVQAGAAIVATNVGGTSDVLGDAGILVEDADQLAGQVMMLLADPDRLAELRHGAKQRAEQLPDAGDLVTQLTSVYTELAASG